MFIGRRGEQHFYPDGRIKTMLKEKYIYFYKNIENTITPGYKIEPCRDWSPAKQKLIVDSDQSHAKYIWIRDWMSISHGTLSEVIDLCCETKKQKTTATYMPSISNLLCSCCTYENSSNTFVLQPACSSLLY